MSATEHPVISVQFDGEQYTLMATSYGQTTPAGPRLFRASPHPRIDFSHERREDADRDALKLREYIAATWPAKPPSKKKLREAYD